MSVVKMTSQCDRKKELPQGESKQKKAAVYSLEERRKMIAFEKSNLNMKLIARELDWL